MRLFLAGLVLGGASGASGASGALTYAFTASGSTALLVAGIAALLTWLGTAVLIVVFDL
ncbi:hypothetical protein AB0N09_28005 [Streptomyces erythrochromogenes]|uniref:hypothetical protein n=1 Tax=Streptomyces erythrochromogenes TaxID=285574 RepID=UPI00343D52CF